MLTHIQGIACWDVWLTSQHATLKYIRDNEQQIQDRFPTHPIVYHATLKLDNIHFGEAIYSYAYLPQDVKSINKRGLCLLLAAFLFNIFRTNWKGLHQLKLCFELELLFQIAYPAKVWVLWYSLVLLQWGSSWRDHAASREFVSIFFNVWSP